MVDEIFFEKMLFFMRKASNMLFGIFFLVGNDEFVVALLEVVVDIQEADFANCPNDGKT